MNTEQRFPGIPTHGGRYVQYNLYGNLFEVSRKYVPPIRPVGRGAYGIVCAAVNSETGEEVAIKKVSKAFDNRIDAKRTLREIKLLQHMNHDNVSSEYVALVIFISDGCMRTVSPKRLCFFPIGIRLFPCLFLFPP